MYVDTNLLSTDHAKLLSQDVVLLRSISASGSPLDQGKEKFRSFYSTYWARRRKKKNNNKIITEYWRNYVVLSFEFANESLACGHPNDSYKLSYT